MTTKHKHVGLKASQEGLVRIHQARIEKGWTLESDRWAQAASRILDPAWHEDMPPANGASSVTWRRFFQGKHRIKAESFKAFCAVLALNWEDIVERGIVPTLPPIPSTPSHHSWGEAPDTTMFYGRSDELATLVQWVLGDAAEHSTPQHCRLVMVLGMGGIGKTTVATKLAQLVQGSFDRIIWRSLLNAPPLLDLLDDLLRFLSREPERPHDLAHLLDCLRHHRCLIVLDNAESILQSGEHSGNYRHGYEGYGDLLRRIGESAHQSCLILTSREKPDNLVILEGEQLAVRSLRLSGLPDTIGQQILVAMNLRGTVEEYCELVDRYSGNPQALKLVAASIRELCSSNIGEFLQQGVTFFNSIRSPLEQQFNRLSELEQKIMYWLAINREPMSTTELADDIIPTEPLSALLEALGSLVRRCLIEEVTTPDHAKATFTQQPVVMEYMTDRLIDHVVEQVSDSRFQVPGSRFQVPEAASTPDPRPLTPDPRPLTPDLQPLTPNTWHLTPNTWHLTPDTFHTYALIKAQAKDYVRDSQVRLILEPIASRLQRYFVTRDALEGSLTRMLDVLRRHHPTGYGSGNLLNLCRYLRIDLTGYDFSYLTIRQAYLPDVSLHNVNFAYAHLIQSVFAQNLGGFLTVTVSPDGTWMATGDSSGEVLLWKVADGTQRFAFREHGEWVNALAFSADSRILATGGDDQIIRLWDVETGQRLQKLQGHRGSIHALAFCLTLPSLEQGKSAGILASGGDDQVIYLWHLETGTCSTLFTGHDDRILALAFSPDGAYLVSGDPRHIKCWDVATGDCLQTLDAMTNRSWAFSFPAWSTTSSIMLAAGSDDRTVTLWNVTNGKCLAVLTGHTSSVQTVTFSPDATLLASSSTDQIIKLWDVATKSCLQTFGEANHGVWSLSFGATSLTNSTLGDKRGILVSGGDDQMVKLWDVASGRCLRTLQGHTRRVWSFALSHDHRLLATGSDDRTIRLWDIATGQCLQTLEGHTDWVWAVTFGLDDRLLASGSDDNTIRLWDVTSGQCLQTLHGHSDRVHAVTFRPALDNALPSNLALAFGQRSHVLASGSSDQTVRLWDFTTGECLEILHGHTNRIWSLAFNASGDRLASGSYDSTVRLWDVATGDCLHIFQEHSDRVHTLAFCPIRLPSLAQGDLLASAGDDQIVNLWNIDTGECIQQLHGHTQRICSLAFSPDGSQLVTGSDDHTVRLWDIMTGKCLQIFQGHTNRVWFTSLIADGQLLLSGSHDGTVKLWAVHTGKCRKTLGPGKPYEGMNIYNTTGLTSAQRTTLRTLGAIEAMTIP